MTLLSDDREPFRLPPMQGMSDQDESDLFSFSGSVGPNGENRREDVIKAQTLLARTGDFDPDGVFKVPTGWPSSDLYRGIRKLQKRAGRTVDGMLLPIPAGGVDQNGVGETLDVLRGELGDSLAGQKAPTPKEADAHYEAEARRNATSEAGPAPSQEKAGNTSGTTDVVLSDVPDIPLPVWQDGGQSAQMSPLQQQITQQAAQATQRLLGLPPGPGKPPRDQHGVSDDEKKAASELQRRGAETINLLNFAPQLVGKVIRDPQASLLADKLPKMPPSEPISDSDKAAAQTPPLAPPQVEGKLQGRPAAEHEPSIEQLIPPEMKDWYGGLEPFDQELAKELMLVFINKDGSLGKEATQRGNSAITRVILDVLRTNHPEMAKWVRHTHGATRDGAGLERRKEEYLRNVDDQGNVHRAGSGRPDVVFEFARNIARRIRFNSSSQNAGGGWTSAEDLQAVKHGGLTKEGRPTQIEKLQEGEEVESYMRTIRSRIERVWREVEQELKDAGEFDKPDPEKPAEYKYWYQKKGLR